MKITNVTAFVHERRMPATFGPPTIPITVMTISTDQGINGHVFISGPGPAIGEQLMGVAKPMLIGRNP